MARSGRSSLDLPRWWSGWANLTPSAVRKFTLDFSDTSSWNYQNINWHIRSTLGMVAMVGNKQDLG